jgi:hypothetical protein
MSLRSVEPQHKGINLNINLTVNCQPQREVSNSVQSINLNINLTMNYQPHHQGCKRAEPIPNGFFDERAERQAEPRTGIELFGSARVRFGCSGIYM